MDAHLFKEIEETLQSDGVRASWCWGESHTVARRIILDLRRRRSRNSRRVAKSMKWMSKCCRKMDRRKYFERSYSCMDQREIENRNKMIHRRSSKLVFYCMLSKVKNSRRKTKVISVMKTRRDMEETKGKTPVRRKRRKEWLYGQENMTGKSTRARTEPIRKTLVG